MGVSGWSTQGNGCPRLAVDASLRLPLTLALGPERVQSIGIVEAQSDQRMGVRFFGSPSIDAAALGALCIAVVRSQETAQLAARQCARHVAPFESPRSPYRRLLASPAFRRVLSLARSDYRMSDLAARAEGWAIDVYRIDPEECR